MNNNQRYLLRTIIKHGPITKRGLQYMTEMSWTMISSEVNELTNMGYIVSCNHESVAVGRKAKEYDVNTERNYFIGLELNFKGIYTVITDLKGRVIESFQEEFHSNFQRDVVLDKLYVMLDTIFDKYQEHDILGIGMAIQGLVDKMQGISVRIHGIRDWHDIPIKQLLEERYDVEVSVEHNPSCYLRSEKAFGALKNSDITEAIMVSIDHRSGIGMATMINGRTYDGAYGRAGEIGYSIVRDSANAEEKYLERHIVRENIVRDYKKLTGDQQDITYKEIEQRALEGESVCYGIYEQLGKDIGVAVSNACNILNPMLVVIHATSCASRYIMYEQIEKITIENAFDKNVKIVLSKLERDAAPIGGALLAVETAIEWM